MTVAPEPVKVVDTVGAGDTFNAGILASLHEQGALTKAGSPACRRRRSMHALTLGAKAAAVTVSRAGANPPWRHEIALNAGLSRQRGNQLMFRVRHGAARLAANCRKSLRSAVSSGSAGSAGNICACRAIARQAAASFLAAMPTLVSASP